MLKRLLFVRGSGEVPPPNARKECAAALYINNLVKMVCMVQGALHYTTIYTPAHPYIIADVGMTQ